MKNSYKYSLSKCNYVWNHNFILRNLDFWKHRLGFYEYGFFDKMLIWELKKDYAF